MYVSRKKSRGSGLMARDPVCGMDVNEEKADRMEYKGKKYYFCCPSCKFAFKRNPEQFVENV